MSHWPTSHLCCHFFDSCSLLCWMLLELGSGDLSLLLDLGLFALGSLIHLDKTCIIAFCLFKMMMQYGIISLRFYDNLVGTLDDMDM